MRLQFANSATTPIPSRAVVRRAAARAAAVMLAVLVASCGGGGGGGSASSPGPAPTPTPTPTPTGANITGYVVEGPVAGATVKLYRLDAAGAKTLLGSAVTDASGLYTIPNAAPASTAILVEANGGTYTDDITSQPMPLAVPLRAVATSSGGDARISVTPYSEVAVRVIEHMGKPDWSGAGIDGANKKVADNLGATTILDFIPVDLRTAPPAGARDNDVGMSFYTSGFSGYARRLDANPASSLNSALDGFYRLTAVDEHDDRVLPAYLGGMADFVDRTALTDSVKQQLKALVLLGNESYTPRPGESVDDYRPTGIASGAATATMQDDAFQAVDTRDTGAMFNGRGALVAFPVAGGAGAWRVLYTASAAEVFGDGDIGIGRWNGGGTVLATRAGSELTVTGAAGFLKNDSLHYAVARPASAVPTCGMRRLALVATTLPTLSYPGPGAQPVVAGLTSDSSVSFQYASDTLAGFDIGVRATDGSVTRYRSPGGVDAPWAGGITLSGLSYNPLPLQVATAGTVLSGMGMDVHGFASGNGATKLVLKLVVGRDQGPTELAAAFASPTGGVDSNGCAEAVGNPGAAIDPPPSSGSNYVMGGINGQIIFGGLPVDTAFRTRGELSTTPAIHVGQATPIYELAGTADASIGRVAGAFTVSSVAYDRSMPYAVARPGAVLPATGTRHYVLAASTLVVPELAGAAPGGSLQPGTVQAASLDVNFGESPLGTPNPFAGTVQFRVSGSVSGVPFSVGAAGTNGTVPAEASVGSGQAFFFTNQFTGAFAAPGGNDVVVWYTTDAGKARVMGTLLFRAQ